MIYYRDLPDWLPGMAWGQPYTETTSAYWWWL